MSMTLNERNPNIDLIPVGVVGAGATVIVPGIYMRKHSRIKNVYFADSAAIAASGVNYLTVTLQDNTAVAYAAGNTQAGIAANTQLPLALSNPVGDVANNPEADVLAGTMMTAKVVSNGSAVSTKGILLIEWYPL